jgi:hypothetical protein
MAARMRQKPGGAEIGVTIGDFADTRGPGEFSLTYLVFNTINNVTTQDDQVACFVNVAAHLKRGGTFVIEVGVPALRLLPPGQRAVPFDVGEKYWTYDLYDCATQSMSSNYVDDDGTAAAVDPVPLRVAQRTRPDGAHRRTKARRAMAGLGRHAVRPREHAPRLVVAKAHLDNTGGDGGGPTPV